jgi:hypothetical protein
VRGSSPPHANPPAAKRLDVGTQPIVRARALGGRELEASCASACGRRSLVRLAADLRDSTALTVPAEIRALAHERA